MRRFGRVPVPQAVDHLWRGAVRALTPRVDGAAALARRLWSQRFHWPVLTLGAAVLGAAVMAPVMATSTVAHHSGHTVSASAWPGLARRAENAPLGVSAAPARVVPGCSNGTGSSGQPAALRAGRPAGGVLTPQGSDRATRVTLTALDLSSPLVTSVTPSSGPVTGGTPVVIDGSGFTGAVAVTFGLVPALFSVVSDTQITTTSSPGVGTVDVRVLGLGGLSPTTTGDQFSYLLPPTGSLGPPSAPTTTVPSPTTTTTPRTTSGAPPGRSVPAPTGPAPSPGLSVPTVPTGGVMPGFGSGWGYQALGCSLIDNQTGVPVAGESAAQQRAVSLALSLIGTPYVWGGESTKGFDCSGLVQFVFSAAGVELPRVAQDQYDAGPAVPPGQAVVPGDLVFFGTGPSGVSHVGIFVGHGVMVDAPHTGADVRLDQISGFESIVGVTSPGG